MDFMGDMRRNMSRRFDAPLRSHLMKVYGIFHISILGSMLGAYLQMAAGFDLGIFSAFGSLLAIFLLNLYKENGKNTMHRVCIALGFAFCSGQSLGPLLTDIIIINEKLLISGAAGAAIAFYSLTLGALIAQEGKYLYLGSLLIASINCMAVASLCNIFLQSGTIQFYQLYLGIFVMAAFVVYDTQNIIEKFRRGNGDVVQHSMDIFFDLISIFRRLVIILAQKENQQIAKASIKHSLSPILRV